MRKLLLNLLFVAIVSVGVAENNKNKSDIPSKTDASIVDLSGTITDDKTGESLAGVEVSLKGTDLKAYTDFDGKFSFKNVKKGQYDIISNYISYEKQMIQNVQIDQTKNKFEIKLKSSN